MPIRLSHSELTKIETAGRLDGESRDMLEQVVQKSALASKYAAKTERRISRDDIENAANFAKKANYLLTQWRNMPDSSKHLFFVMAHSGQSKYHQPLLSIDDDELSEFLDTDSCDAAIQSDLEELCSLGWLATEYKASDGRPEKSLGAKAIVDCLHRYWTETLNRKATFTHDGSIFGNFVREVTNIIAPREIENVSTYVRRLPKQ
jgi:hypothetical protein